MATEDKLTLTQNNPDGSQSILEITSKTLSPEEVNADPSLLDIIIDAIFDFGDDDQQTYLVPAGYAESNLQFEPMSLDGPVEFNPASNVEFAGVSTMDYTQPVGQTAEWNSMPYSGLASEMSVANPWSDDSNGLASSNESTPSNEDEGTQPEGPDYHQAARDAQESANDFIYRGDYRAAQEAREQAEQFADQAGDQSMLSLYDSQDLGFAAERQELADQYRQEQADLIQKGDYEGARESALQSGYATRDADSLAGGMDHSGQAGRDVQSLDWAVWNEKNADANLTNAQQAANDGDFEKAGMYAEQAGWQQASADQYAEQANPDSLQWNYDPSSAVETGGSFDATLNSIDTGFTPTTDYSSGTDFSSGSDDMTV